MYEPLELLEAVEEKAAELARKDINFFCEYVMRDERGDPFRQERIHKLWHAFIDLCEAHNVNPVILASWGSGKSSQIAIARVLWELGRNPNLRIKIVCNCLAAGTPVWTSKGPKPIEEVSPGDQVISRTEAGDVTWGSVSRVWFGGRRKVVKVHTRRQDLTCTPEHQFLTVEKRDFVWKEAGELRPGDFVITYVGGLPKDREDYQGVLTEDFLWAVGYFLGDGHWGKYRIQWTAKKKTFEVQERLRTLFGDRVRNYNGQLVVNSKALCDLWRELGLAERTAQKRIPEWVWRLPRNLKLALLEGFLAADGHIGIVYGSTGKPHLRMDIFGTNYRLILDLYQLCAELGFRIGRILEQKPATQAVIKGRPIRSAKTIYRFASTLESDARGKTFRGYWTPEWLKRSLGAAWGVQKVLAVEDAGYTDVYDLTVEETSNYVANNFLTHNSDLNAKLRVASIGRYIVESPEYQRVFPNVVPDRNAFWSAHELFVKRSSRSVDPSVEAKGIMSTGVGGRADLIVFDDVVDLRNAIEQPALREKVKENFFNVWMSRLDVGGRAWYISTSWHAEDLTSLLRYDRSRRDTFWVMVQEVTDDLHYYRVTLEVPSGVEHTAREWMRRAVGDLWDEPDVLHSE